MNDAGSLQASFSASPRFIQSASSSVALRSFIPSTSEKWLKMRCP
jgi:hypothetical protein